MKTSKKMLPPLRFPEFSDSWQIRTIDQVLRRHSVAVEVEPETLYTQMGIRSHGKGIFHKEPVTGLSLGEKRVFWVQQDCLILNIIFAWEQAVAKTSERESGLIASHRFPMYQPKEREACIDFFVRFFLRPQGKHLLGLASPGGAGRNRTLGQKEFEKLKVIIPSLPEQQKIAAFLTAVDDRIGQLSQKKALLEEYKKGVMQQLFTQALRFKDDSGKDFPQWQQRRYDSIYSFKNTNCYSRELLTYEEGEVRNIHYGDIHTKFRSNFYLSQELVPFIKPEVNLKRIADECYCREGDLVIADASEDYADVGKCIEIRDLAGQRTLAGLHTFIARPKRGTMAPGFGAYLMQSREMRLKIMRIAQGTKVLAVSKPMLSKLTLPIPSLPEQTKIANFLTALDRKIESVATQITETQTFKKGLLQQMFG
jgi:type I restriction enzyme S subunit